MTAKQNINHIKNDMNKKDRRQRYRRISIPKKSITKNIDRPFSQEFANGNFRNDIYFSMNSSFIVWVYIKNILLFCIPAFLLHGVMFMIHRISIAVLGDEYAAPLAAFQLLFFAYAICLFFAYRKISDHIAYFNVAMLVSKYNINTSYLSMMYQSQNGDSGNEMTVMNHYRQRFNKYSLFPSLKELALEEQLYQKQSVSSQDSVRQYAETRRVRLNMENKRQEHLAAKEIADRKQAQSGGVNEYDAIVAKYKNRTVPAIRDIIRDVQQQSI